jgi:hypothetical protein
MSASMPALPPVPALASTVETTVVPPVPPTTVVPPVPGRVDVEDPPVLVAPPAPVVDAVPVPLKATVRPGAMLSVAVAAPTLFGAKITQTSHKSEVSQ